MASGSGDGRVKIWDVENGTVTKEIKVNNTVRSLEVLRDGELACASGKSIMIWN